MQNQTVKQFLSSLPKGETIYYRANPGNAGDALIACGTFKAFNDAGLHFEFIDPDNFDATGKTVIYAGGGNLVGLYPHARDFFQKFHKSAKQLVLLPHTVAKNEDLLSELGSNVVLFARETPSHEHLKTHCTQATVYIDDDMAFSLTPEDVFKYETPGFLEALFRKIYFKVSGNTARSLLIPSPPLMIKNSLFEFSTLKGNNNSLNAYRTDDEAISSQVPANNHDLSGIYNYGTRAPSIAEYATKRLFSYLNNFSKINTDRLHICIAGALLGKEVEFHPNGYFKCRAVYEYSLKDKYPNVNWHDA